MTPDNERRAGVLRAVVAAVVGVGVICALSLPAAAGQRMATVTLSESVEAVVESTTASTTPADTTTPETTTSESEPTTPGETLVGAGDPDGDIDTTVAVIAVVGFLALLAVASWWMVRRPDPDGQPMPPTDSPPPSDLI